MQNQLVIENELSIINHLFSVDRYGEAEKHIQKVLSAEPNHPIALYNLAVVQSSIKIYQLQGTFANKLL